MAGDRFIELAGAEGRQVLDVLFRHASEAVTVQDQSGGLVYANDRAARLVGLGSGPELMTAPLGEVMAGFEMIDESGSPLPVEHLPGHRVLADVEAVAEQVIGYRRRGSETVEWSRVRASAIKDDSGRVVWAINYFLDITEQVRRAEGDRLLDRASQMMSSLDLSQNLEALGEIVVPELANWYGVHLVDDEGFLVKVAAAYPASAEAEALLALTDQNRMRLDSDYIQARVVRSGSEEVLTEIPPEALEAAGARIAELVRALRIRSVACLPLGPRERPIGTLTVARSGDRPGFDRLDLEILEDMAHRAGIALVNARMYEQDRELTRILSKGLVPGRLPQIEGLLVAARHRPLARPGDLGGDFYDMVALDGAAAALLVGDIEGKGIGAAAAVGLIRHTFRATVRVDPDPAAVLGGINAALLDEDSTRMCTLAYLLIRPSGPVAELTVALAGHPPPVLQGATGEMEVLGSPCPPAGLLTEIVPLPQRRRLRAGDRLYVYTDGFCLRDRTPPETILPLLAQVSDRDLDQILDGLLQLLSSSGAEVQDDVVLVALELGGQGEPMKENFPSVSSTASSTFPKSP